MEKSPILVVGGGIAGIRASMDLANLGFKVYLLECSPSIGGTVAQLDKIFPTHDCAICALTHELNRLTRNPNIEIITNAEVKNVTGQVGNFQVSIIKKARYVDEEKCNGCGLCAEVCPIEVPDEFEQGLKKRKAIYIKYPQAYPPTYVIDMENCTKCGKCIEVCKLNAINLNDADKELTLNVGSIILALGFQPFDASLKSEYGYGKYPNIITSLQLERILNAAGPYQGSLVRPSDGKTPKKIAFLQCVGSRDALVGNLYCSSVCCMYAIKAAMAAKEYVPEADCTIFYMDIRTSGKDYELYYKRAEETYGIRFVRSRASRVEYDPAKETLLVHYVEDGKPKSEEFDMVVLAIGFTPPKNAEKIAEIFGIKLNQYGFCQTGTFKPVETSVPGVYVCGAFAAPKDIPGSITDASAAVAKSLADLTIKPQIPASKPAFEREVSSEPPKIGVFICSCGLNIGGVIDLAELANYTKGLPNVAYIGKAMYLCSNEGRKRIEERIREYNLNRVVVAACTPRTHEELFQETLANAGLNPYLLEMVNLREQCAWPHMNEPEKALKKAKDLIRSAVAKARKLQPIEKPRATVTPAVLVVGGGLAGMTAALQLAKMGFKVHLVEKEKELGGHLRHIHYILGGENPQENLRRLIEEVNRNERIHVYLGAEPVNITGYVGNYRTLLRTAEGTKEIDHGAIILAVGAEEYKPKEYLYGEDPRVLTQRELEEKLAKGEFNAKTVVMIQCVGSRDEERPNCSRICCAEAVKNALKIKEVSPETDIYVLYKDIRTFGFYEDDYRQASKKGVVFINYDDEHKPKVSVENGKLKVLAWEPELKSWVPIEADMLVLSAGVVPSPSIKQLAETLKLPLTHDGFFLETHMKLHPVETSKEGVFICGLAHSPKFMEETIAQACAAATKAAELLAREALEFEGIVATVNEDLCSGCRICESLCPYEAITMEEKEEGKLTAHVTEALCKGCGLCGSACPTKAITLGYYTNEQILSQVKAMLTEEIA